MSPSGGPGATSGLLPDTTVTDLSTACSEREAEAGTLLAAGFSSVALALRVYSLEIRLKVLICRHLNLEFLPKACKTHDLSELLIFTGRLAELDDPANVAIRQNWDLLVKFSKERLNDLRYLPRASLAPTELARHMAALDDPSDGVLAWLSRHP